jgi:serine/threonine protein phosphatase PrpC
LVVLEALPFLTGFLGLREPTRVRLLALREEALWQASLLPFGVPAAFVQIHLGVLGGILVGLPLLIAARARYVWKDARYAHLETVRTLMAALDAFDPFTRGHSYRVAKMSVRVGRHLGLDAHALEELEYAALLHDVARTAMREDQLPRNPSLSAEQQSVLRQHPQRGGDIVARFGFYPGAADVVYAHHEQPDGQGYPRGLSAEQIPVGSLIIMVVAAFDAMTSDRPYRRGLDPEAALDELRVHAGLQFSPQVVAALVSVYTGAKLFDDFAPEVLEQYARGDGNSRAIHEHLRRTGTPPPATQHVDLDEMIGADDVPTLEVPAGTMGNADQPQVLERQLRLSDDGSWRLDVGALSDVGCVRENNEDAFGTFEHARRSSCLLVVADGMGGAAAGEVASRLAVETLRSAFMDGERTGTVQDTLRQSIQVANEAIRGRAAASEELYGMGTTCVAASVSSMQLHVGHVGDSRAYLVDPGGIRQITRDHNLAEELKCVVGASGPEGAQHVLTRSLGSRPGVEVDVSEPIRLHQNHVLVLCSDGLSNLVGPDEVRDICLQHAPAAACARLVALARDRGAPDNVTVQVARVRRT